MPLGPGVRLGPYRIESPIGAGGMGEVYRARDTRLDRTVAIKLLAADIAADPQFRERFEREARTIASLDHPHICTLFDIGRDEVAGIDYLVMQHIEGETLADRLANVVPVPVDQALRYAIQMAAALDAAHRAGVVHRDLKPANVMITTSGIKLLDFGVAKRLGAGTSTVEGATIAATQANPLTERGSLLGTLQYMSPEQLEDGDVDVRSDTFSLGAVLYEMFTGQRAFEGKSRATVIAAILNRDPPPLAALAGLETRLPAAARRTLDRLLHKCLAKNPNDRWQSTADLADELRWIEQERLRGEQSTDARAAARPRTRERIWMGLAAAASLIAVVVVALAAREFLRPPPPTITFTIDAPDKERIAGGAAAIAMSPDGSRVAFLAGSDHRLWVRSLDSPIARVLAGTENASQPSWSPDSRFLLFTVGPAGGKLKKVDAAGGAPTTVTDFALGRSAWSPAGVIVFQARSRELMRINEDGGDATPVTVLDKSEGGHVWPSFLSDGRRFLYLGRTAGTSQTTLNLGSIDTMSRTRLAGDFSSNVEYRSGHVLFSRAGKLTMQPFDEKAGRLSGSPTPVVEGLLFNADNGRTAFSESANGVLAYRMGTDISAVDLVWYDRAGAFLGAVGDTAAYFTLRTSPDGHRLAVARRDAAAHTDLWIDDLDRGISTRLTSDSTDNRSPVWSPDGSQVFFASNRNGSRDLYVRQASGAGPEELLYASPEDKIPTGVSPDGRLLLFDRIPSGTRRLQGSDIWALPLKGDRTPFPVVATPSRESDAVFSPDGRWIAYESGDVGTTQIYVQPFPMTGMRIQVSSAGGVMPAWTADSKQVVYAGSDVHLMAVDVAPSGRELRPARPRALPIPFVGGPARLFAMIGNGERFLVPRVPSDEATSPITVVVNWQNALKK